MKQTQQHSPERWTVRKITDGAKAGKWALVTPLGDIRDFYPTKQAADRDCLGLNIVPLTAQACELCGSNEPFRLCANHSTGRVVVDECKRLLLVEEDLLRATGLCDVRGEELSALRAENARLREALSSCVDELELYEKMARQDGDTDLLTSLKQARAALAKKD